MDAFSMEEALSCPPPPRLEFQVTPGSLSTREVPKAQAVGLIKKNLKKYLLDNKVYIAY
jgi:hypothetical protein